MNLYKPNHKYDKILLNNLVYLKLYINIKGAEIDVDALVNDIHARYDNICISRHTQDGIDIPF